MGYTHYWTVPERVNTKEYNNALEVINKLRKKLPTDIKLCSGNGEGNAEFTPKYICFNGDATKGAEHETFYFEPKSLEFDFCKTARKPYDFMVCLCLLALEDNIKHFSYSSDGDAYDWKEAKAFYKKHKDAPFVKIVPKKEA